MRIYGNLSRWLWLHFEVLRQIFFSSLLQFLASRDFVDGLGLLKCSKDFHNSRNLEIMFLVSKLEPDWFKWRPIRLECLLFMFPLSGLTIFKFIRWSVNSLSVSATLPLAGISVGVEIVTSAYGNFSWIKDFKWSNWSQMFIDVNLTAAGSSTEAWGTF